MQVAVLSGESSYLKSRWNSLAGSYQSSLLTALLDVQWRNRYTKSERSSNWSSRIPLSLPSGSEWVDVRPPDQDNR